MDTRKVVGEGVTAAEAGGSSVSRDVGLREHAGIHGYYTVQSVGPLEGEREAYVTTRDRLYAARRREEDLARSVKSQERRAPRGLRRVMLAVVAAIGLTAAATPAMADLTVLHGHAKQTVAQLQKRLDAFVLEEKWVEADFPNLVTTVGKNLALDTVLAGSAYTTTGPYMLLIDTNANLAAVGNTMASHSAWLEVGATNAPAYTAPRKTIAFSSASAGSKAASSAASFAITSPGTVGGCGLVLGSGAVSTIDNTSGTLYSAGAFTGGSKVVANGDTLNVTYTASM